MIRLEGYHIDATRFPDNTSQVWKIGPEVWAKVKQAEKPVEVKWVFSHEGEFMELAQLKDLLDHLNIPACLVMRYLPYGRQDKQINNESTFALHTFAKLLNTLQFASVSVLDAHSPIATSLIERCANSYPENEVKRLLYKLPCYPDRGANNKYSDIYGPGVYGHKARDQLTGEITSYAIHGNVKDRDILVIDDICDGGATFIALAKALKAAGASSIEMFVTHGLFTKGTRCLFDAGYSRIYTPQGEEKPRNREQNV